VNLHDDPVRRDEPHLLFYEADEDCAERRTPIRQLHSEHARAAEQHGELLLAGALRDPIDGAGLLFQGASAEVAERFALDDPHIINSVVTRGACGRG
jgi:uncharacterized protein